MLAYVIIYLNLFFEFDDKGETKEHQINALSFTNELVFSNNPSRQLNNGTRIFLVGDACMSSFYPAGFSSQIALNQAILAVDLICNPLISLFQYNNFHQRNKTLLKSSIELIGKRVNRNFAAEYDTQQKSQLKK